MRLINDESLYRIEDKRGKKRQMFTSFAYTPISHSYETLNQYLQPQYINNDASRSKLSQYCSAYNGMYHTKLSYYCAANTKM